MTTSNMYANMNNFPEPTSNTKAKIDVFPLETDIEDDFANDFVNTKVNNSSKSEKSKNREYSTKRSRLIE